MNQMRPASAHGLEGKTPIGEAHGPLQNLPDQQTQGSAVWEPESIDPKARVRTHQARRPVVDEGGCMRSNT